MAQTSITLTASMRSNLSSLKSIQKQEATILTWQRDMLKWQLLKLS